MATKRLTAKTLRTLERLESNYKLIYTIIMSAPLLLAMEILLVTQNQQTGFLQFKNIADFTARDGILFVLYLIFYTRFFLGDLRYLDLKYLEHQNEDSYLERYSSSSRLIDFFSLTIHAIFFYALAASITNLKYFYFITLIILLLNAGWLSIIYFATEQSNRERYENRSSIKWAINNLFCSLALVAYLCFYSTNLYSNKTLMFFSIILGANSILDFILAWKMYFPRLKEEIVEAE